MLCGQDQYLAPWIAQAKGLSGLIALSGCGYYLAGTLEKKLAPLPDAQDVEPTSPVEQRVSRQRSRVPRGEAAICERRTDEGDPYQGRREEKLDSGYHFLFFPFLLLVLLDS